MTNVFLCNEEYGRIRQHERCTLVTWPNERDFGVLLGSTFVSESQFFSKYCHTFFRRSYHFTNKQNSLVNPSDNRTSSTMEGSLSKWTNVMKGWQFRWFVLDKDAGLFSYYTSREKMNRGLRRGCVRLQGAVLGIDNEDDTTFTITVDGKTFHFQVSHCLVELTE